MLPLKTHSRSVPVPNYARSHLVVTTAKIPITGIVKTRIPTVLAASVAVLVAPPPKAAVVEETTMMMMMTITLPTTVVVVI